MTKQVSVHAPNPYGDSHVAVTDEDGNTVQGVREITIWIEANEVTRVDLTIIGSIVNVAGLVNEIEFKCPTCDFKVNHECSGRDDDRSSGRISLRPIQ